MQTQVIVSLMADQSLYTHEMRNHQKFAGGCAAFSMKTARSKRACVSGYTLNVLAFPLLLHS